jgi:hypothetical protein
MGVKLISCLGQNRLRLSESKYLRETGLSGPVTELRNCIMRIYIICMFTTYYRRDQIQEVGGVCNA